MVRFTPDGDPIAEDQSKTFQMPQRLAHFEESEWPPTCSVFGELCTRRRARWETWRIAREAWVEEHGGEIGGPLSAEAYADHLWVLSTADSSHIHEFIPKEGGAR